jgi:DNA-binding transcriptional MerR regulator
MQIGVLSKESGLSIDAIRFYEKQRLLHSPRRSHGGFRLFGEADLAVLRFIKSAQELGFSLEEIRELLTVRSDAAHGCPKMQRLLVTKLAAVESKISSLKAIRSELKSALQKCDVALRNSPASHTDGCPVLKDISEKRKATA